MKYEKPSAEVILFDQAKEFMGGSPEYSGDYFATAIFWGESRIILGLLKCEPVSPLTYDDSFRCETVLARDITNPDRPGPPEWLSWINFTCPDYY